MMSTRELYRPLGSDAAAATLTLPWVAKQVRLAIVQFDQSRVELLRVFPWLE
jgi:hypothetical protein